ncbi:MAG: PSD1 and planctomycete cytochrome C domain-containing protein [Fuerstiella sp.]
MNCFLKSLSVRFTLLVITACSGQLAADDVSFNRDIRPLLSDRCFSCHGFDEEHREADLRLDRREGAEDWLAPGEPDDSEILRRIISDDDDEVMPPPHAHKPRFTDAQIELIRTWIKQGAPYETHWSFVPPESELPAKMKIITDDGNIPRLTEIDSFILDRLNQEGQSISNMADKRTLFRRLSFDLTGLPPNADQLKRFLQDDSEIAYEKAVDRLLESERYGEHMARYWLDLVRFSDTNGLHHDHYRDMTPYRDWVIDSFNKNRPYNEFVIDQVAGDLVPNPTTDQLIASGFNRLHLIIDVGTALPEESLNRNVIDRTTAVGTAFMGLTVQCATCHDHKYDPITQRDFYQLYAFFNNFDGQPETGRRGTLDFKRGLQQPYINLPSDEQKTQLAALELAIAAAQKLTRATTNEIKVAQRSSIDSAKITRLENRLKVETKKQKSLQQKRDQLMLKIPGALVMKEREKIRPAHLLVRGQYDQPGEVVERNTPSFLPPMKDTELTRNRLDLAKWLVSEENPLTARVTVNRFWQQFFGTGIVRTSEDFGAQGEVPSHPELLDYLAVQLTQSNWDVKKLVKQIVMSATYRQSSAASPESYANDPKNRLLSRGARFRLDAEVIRDQILAVTGLLNDDLFGKSVKPPQPDGLWKLVAMPYSYPRIFEADTGTKIYRRSLYTFWKRGLPPPQLTIFDAPTREACVARRERTNTPLQALLLMNEQQYFQASMHFAQTLLQRKHASDSQRLQHAYEAVTTQLPSQSAQKRLLQGLQQFKTLYADDEKLTAQMLTHSLSPDQLPTDQAGKVQLSAWTMLIHSLLNLDTTRAHE